MVLCRTMCGMGKCDAGKAMDNLLHRLCSIRQHDVAGAARRYNLAAHRVKVPRFGHGGCSG